jgi:hypothetical protein
MCHLLLFDVLGLMLRLLLANILLSARRARRSLIHIHLFVELLFFQLLAKLRSALLYELVVYLHVHAFIWTLRVMVSLQRINVVAQFGQGKLGLLIALGSQIVLCCRLSICCQKEGRASMHTSTSDQLTRHLPEDFGLGQEIVRFLPVIYTCRNKQVAFDAMVPRNT